MKVSMVLDRRSFVAGAALAAGAVAVTIRSPLSLADPSAVAGVSAVSGTSTDWAVDHIFGTYPPYAHPIPYGRQFAADASPVATSIDAGPRDPFLMI
jgi:hypothetical protein